MINNGLIFPKQRLSYAEKSKNDFHWAKEMIDRLVLTYSKDESYIKDHDSDYQRMLANYQLYNNQLNQKDFERECNPFGLEVGQAQDIVKPYNKAPNKINVILGEEAQRPFNFRTVLVNSEGIRAKQEVKNKMLKDYFMAELEQVIAQHNKEYETEFNLEELIKPEDIDKHMALSYRDKKEQAATQLLEYLVRKLDIKDVMNDSFKHALISGYEFVWVGVQNNEAVAIPLNPLGVFYHKSPETKFIEDGLYAGYRTYMTSGDILDKLGETLTKEQVEIIEGKRIGDGSWAKKKMEYNHTDVSDYYLQNYFNNSIDEGSYGKPSSEDWLVTHVEWKSQKKVGFITDGEGNMDMVSEDFKVPSFAEKSKDENNKTIYKWGEYSLSWGWVPEIWEGIRIGQDIYTMIRPKPNQYRSIDNPWKVCLGYHGLCYSATNADPISLMDRMKPFQYLYFLIMHKLKQLVARDRGQVYHFDESMVSEKLGLEKTLYYLDQMDIDIYNSLQNAEEPGAHIRSRVTNATNRSNMQHIMNYVNLLAALDDQIGDVAGVNRAREGQVSSTEAVGNAQLNRQQSSTITEAIYFKPHELVWKRVMTSLLQCAQVIYAGKKVIKQYVLDDLSVQTLELEPDTLLADFGIFISNSSRDNKIFEDLKSLAQPLIQNDKAKFSDIIQLLKGNSITTLETTIKSSEAAMQKEQLEQIRAQQEAQQAQIQAQQQQKLADQQFEMALQAQKDEAELQREMLKIQAQIQTAPDSTDEEKEQFNKKLKLEYDKLKQQKYLEEKKIEVQKSKASNK